ncbi:MAG: hypothetical protein FWC69_01900 [Defluviitaleaceae bacterium]|nr:hypothetical protein [Defluviitaleaceae bacterium]
MNNNGKIKNIAIALLLGVFILLVAAAFLDGRQYVMSSNQKENILMILEHNNIYAEADILTRYRPKRQVSLSRYDYDIEAISARFFEDGPIQEEIVPGSNIYYCPRTLMSIHHQFQNNELVFEMPGGLLLGFDQAGEAYFEKNLENATQLANAFISEILQGAALDMSLYSISLTYGGDYLLTFYARYRGYIIYNSQVRVRVGVQGITRVFYSNTANNGFFGELLPIFSPDEALLALASFLRTYMDIDGDIYILDMQTIYQRQPGRNIAVPAYLFTIAVSGVHFNIIFNALTNTYMYYRPII